MTASGFLARREFRLWLVAILALLGLLVARGATAQGSALPDFEMVAYQGKEVLGGDEATFSALMSLGSPVVLNFWAPLCPPCREEMPAFQKVYEESGDEFILLGLDVGPFIGLGNSEQAKTFLAENGITYPAAYAISAQPLRDFRVLGMPTTFFISPEGEVVSKHTGIMSEAQLRQQLDALLDASAKER